MACELRPAIETVDLAAILGNGSERDNIVKIKSRSADVPTLVNFIQSCWGVIVLYRSANCRPTFYSNAVV